MLAATGTRDNTLPILGPLRVFTTDNAAKFVWPQDRTEADGLADEYHLSISQRRPLIGM